MENIMNKVTWKDLFGNELVVVKCDTQEQFNFVVNFCGGDDETKTYFGSTYNCLNGYSDGGCGYDSESYFRSGRNYNYTVISYDEFFKTLRDFENKLFESSTEENYPIPKDIWIRERKLSLVKAIYECYKTDTHHDNLIDWILELKELSDVNRKE
jgi:hypothetical protein